MAAIEPIETKSGESLLKELRALLRAATLRPEAEASGESLADLSPVQGALERAAVRAARWVETARADQRSRPLVERMLEQFPLDSAQGKALMSLAEALLRTPDPKRADQLIAERLATIREAGVPGDTDLLLRTGFTLLGAAGRLLPDVLGELSGEFTVPVSLDRWSPRWYAQRCVSRCSCSATPSSSAKPSMRLWRAVLRTPSCRSAPTMCWAKVRAPRRTRSVTSKPTLTRSRYWGDRARRGRMRAPASR